MAGDVKFIRVHGRVVPIRGKGAGGKSKKRSSKSLGQLPDKAYLKYKKGESASMNYKHGDVAEAKKFNKKYGKE